MSSLPHFDHSDTGDRRDQADRAESLARIRDHLLDNSSDVGAFVQAGTLLWEMNQCDEAVAHLDKALSCTGCQIRSGTLQGGTDGNRLNAAERHYKIMSLLAECYGSLRDDTLSERYWRAAAALAPTKADPHVALGTMALQNQQLDRAQRHFEVARQHNVDCIEACDALAMVFQQKQDYASAFEMYLKCLELNPDNMVAMLGLFQTSCKMGSFAKIIHFLEVYIEKHPSDASVLFCLATLYAKDGSLAKAQVAVEQVLDQEPDKQDAKSLLAELRSALAESQST